MMDINEAITLLENAILEAKMHSHDETCTCVDGVNVEALRLVLDEVKKA